MENIITVKGEIIEQVDKHSYKVRITKGNITLDSDGKVKIIDRFLGKSYRKGQLVTVKLSTYNLTKCTIIGGDK